MDFSPILYRAARFGSLKGVKPSSRAFSSLSFRDDAPWFPEGREGGIERNRKKDFSTQTQFFDRWLTVPYGRTTAVPLDWVLICLRFTHGQVAPFSCVSATAQRPIHDSFLFSQSRAPATTPQIITPRWKINLSGVAHMRYVTAPRACRMTT